MLGITLLNNTSKYVVEHSESTFLEGPTIYANYLFFAQTFSSCSVLNTAVILLDASRRGKKRLESSRNKMKARTVVGTGEKSLLSDHGLKLCLGRGGRRKKSAKTMEGMSNIK